MKQLHFFLLLAAAALCHAQIPAPTDAPKPLSPEESAAAFVLPDGFRMEVVATRRLPFFLMPSFAPIRLPADLASLLTWLRSHLGTKPAVEK